MAHALTPPAGLRLVALDIDDTLIPWRGTLAREQLIGIAQAQPYAPIYAQLTAGPGFELAS